MFNPDYKELTLAERLYNGLKEILMTLGLTLLIFSLIFSWALDRRETVQEMEDYKMIDGIEELSPAEVAINSYMLIIVAIFFALPLFSIAVLKFKTKAALNNQLTEPLLEN